MLTEVSLPIDIDDVFNSLSYDDRVKFAASLLDWVRHSDILDFVASNVSFQDVVEAYNSKDVESWLAHNAEDFGYSKV